MASGLPRKATQGCGDVCVDHAKAVKGNHRLDLHLIALRLVAQRRVRQFVEGVLEHFSSHW